MQKTLEDGPKVTVNSTLSPRNAENKREMTPTEHFGDLQVPFAHPLIV